MDVSNQRTGAAHHALERALGVTRDEVGRAAPSTIRGWLRRVERKLDRERNKGAMKHWSYDLNRHLALKSVKDELLNRLHAVPPASKKPA